MKMNNETEQIFLLSAAPSQASTSTQKMGSLSLPPSSQVNLEDVKDFSNVCRTCATVTEFVMPIFAGEGLQNNLADKIKKHLPIQVSEGDELPLVVCYQCASTLLAWHELVQCCIQADTALRAKLRSNQQKSISSNVNNKPSSSLKEKTPDKYFYMSVKNALIDFHKDLEEDHLDVEFVCQKCVEKPAMSTVHCLTEHIRQDHSPDLLKNSVKAFITNYITFEQVLADDSDRETQSNTKEKSDMVLPSLHCPFCASVFSSATRLVYHLNKHVEVSVAGGVMCCDHVYNNKKHFVQHLQEAHVDKTADELTQVVCISCGFTADCVEQLKQHYKDAHNDVKYAKGKIESPNNQKYIPAVCPECNKTFSNKYNMFVHMRGHSHAAEYPCDKCSRTYRHPGNLSHHKKIAHHGILNFICVECGEAFPSRSERDIHTRIHTGETPYKCQHCGNAYRAKNTLTRHLEIHLDIRKYSCEICSKKFRKKSHLDYHVKTHMKTVMPGEESNNETKIKDIIERPEFTIIENGKRYAMCGECNKCVPRGGWARHVRRHRGERRHSCHACGLAFHDSGNLQRHTRAIHSQQRPFACPTCAKAFSRKSHLDDHVKSHSESRTFVCDVCGKGSKSSAALRMHARTHGARVLACVQCGAPFKRRGELRAHRSVHSGERPHACRCGRSFRLRSQLTAHQRVHRNTQTDEIKHPDNASNTLGVVDEIEDPNKASNTLKLHGEETQEFLN